MPLTVLPFILSEYQIKYAMALIEGRAEKPTRENFEVEDEKKFEELKKAGLQNKYYHYFGPNMWDYFRRLAKLANVPYVTPPVIEKIYTHVYLLHKGYKISTYNLHPNVQEMAPAIDADENSIILADGQHLTGLDTVIYCTGYKYSFPFLRHLEILKPTHEMVSPLYLHMAHIDYPDSLFFIGMPLRVLLFILFEYQIKYAMALIEGRAEKPTRENFEVEDEKKFEELKEAGLQNKYYHYFGDNMWDYFRRLAKLANVPYVTPSVIEKLYTHGEQERSKSISTYKSNIYRIIDDENFVFEYVGKVMCD
uniref:Flavin-containing monooxygenase n=1 Tax=Acrobeloides nanus TaxID=290746 RepID=A0A914E2K1_9BILA